MRLRTEDGMISITLRSCASSRTSLVPLTESTCFLIEEVTAARKLYPSFTSSDFSCRTTFPITRLALSSERPLRSSTIISLRASSTLSSVRFSSPSSEISNSSPLTSGSSLSTLASGSSMSGFGAASSGSAGLVITPSPVSIKSSGTLTSTDVSSGSSPISFATASCTATGSPVSTLAFFPAFTALIPRNNPSAANPNAIPSMTFFSLPSTTESSSSAARNSVTGFCSLGYC